MSWFKGGISLIMKVPRNHKEALQLDKENRNTKWADAEVKEIDELNSLHSFRSIGKGTPTPKGYKKIPIFFAYAVKEMGRFKARFVAVGHVLPPPIHLVYSGIVSLCNVCLVMFTAELNNLVLFATGDVSMFG